MMKTYLILAVLFLLIDFVCKPDIIIDIPYFISFEIDNQQYTFNKAYFDHRPQSDGYYSFAFFADDQDSVRLILSSGFKAEKATDLEQLKSIYSGSVEGTIDPDPEPGEFFFAPYYQTGYFMDNNNKDKVAVRFGPPTNVSSICFDVSINFEVKADNESGGKTHYKNGLGKIQICEQ